ncbi:hypothetical protein Sjap_022586 [Stephania japonica]|uniref:Homeobox domain-containing protein n=1 Tax=Stephania japonica TaxID=461633 RepID=A0AAP0EXZ8_9MAGN
MYTYIERIKKRAHSLFCFIIIIYIHNPTNLSFISLISLFFTNSFLYPFLYFCSSSSPRLQLYWMSKMSFEDHQACNIGLGLGIGGGQVKFETLRGKPDRQRSNKPSLMKFDYNLSSSSPSMSIQATSRLEPSLTLGLLSSDESNYQVNKIDVNKFAAADSYDQDRSTDEGAPQRQASSPHTVLSSFSNASVKRERDLGCGEEMEVEKVVSSRVISDEDEEGSGRKKLRLTKEQSALLEESFKEHSTLNPKQKQALAKQLNLRPRQVEVWFQNRRARTKLKQTEVDCEYLKKCCESLTDENRRLHKELQELKALKLAQPLYMQLPAATLTMCPSCERIGNGGVADQGSAKNAFGMAGKPHHFYSPFTTTHSSAAC